MGMIMFVLKVVFYLPARLFGYNLFRKKVKKGELSNLPSQISWVHFRPNYFVSSKDFAKAYKKCITENTDHLVGEVLEGVTACKMVSPFWSYPDAAEMSEEQALSHFSRTDLDKDQDSVILCCTPYVATLIEHNKAFYVLDSCDITDRVYSTRQRLLQRQEREAAYKRKVEEIGKIDECPNCGWGEPTPDVDGDCNNCGYKIIDLDDVA